MNHGYSTWGDLDNDGDLDIILVGTTDDMLYRTTTTNFRTQVYRNTTRTNQVVPIPVITSEPLARGEVGVAFSFQIVASNNPTNFVASGLPPGLTLDGVSGLISGTPTVPGTNFVTVSASNTGGAGGGELMLIVAPSAEAPLTVVDTDATRIAANSTDNIMVRDSAGRLFIIYAKRANYCYVKSSADDGGTWSSEVRTESFPNAGVARNLGIDNADVLYQGLQFNVGVFFNKSTDHGATWSEALPLHDGGWGDWDYGPSLAVEGNGTVHALFYKAFGWGDWPLNINYRKSLDGGSTWNGGLDLTQIPNTDVSGRGAEQSVLIRNQAGHLMGLFCWSRGPGSRR